MTTATAEALNDNPDIGSNANSTLAEGSMQGSTDLTDAAEAGDQAASSQSAEGDDTASSAGGKKRAPRRPPPTGAMLDQIAKKAKEDFLRSYQGARLTVPTQLRNHVVVRAYSRTWATVLRNWNTCMTVQRSVLGDASAATGVEQQLLSLLGKISNSYKGRSQQLEHILSDNENAPLAVQSLSYQNPINEAIPVLGPVAFTFRTVLLAADSLLDKAMVAYTIGEISSDEFEKIKWDVKRSLKSIDTLARNLRTMSLQRSREAGLARPGYKAANDEAQEKDGGLVLEAG